MYSSMWFMSIVALLVVDVRTGALQDSDIKIVECHSCHPSNGTSCDQPSWPSVRCPSDRPLCATVAASPDFASWLTCAAASKTPCSLKNPSNNSFELTCVCNSPLCNVPFASQLRNQLLNFTHVPKNNMTDITQMFLKSSKFTNVTEENLYRAITIEAIETTTTPVKNMSQGTTGAPVTATATINTLSILRDSEKPRAEPLKQEPTVPSEDDEDESEGSGAYEDSRIHNHAVSAPAAPSSFLPAKENHAPPLYTDALLILLFTCLVV